MLFNSLAFATFLPIVFILYWQLPHKYRWILLLAASYYFYMSWNVKYVVLILFTTLVSYLSGILLEKGYAFHENMIKFGLNKGDIVVICHTTYSDEDNIPNKPLAWLTYDQNSEVLKLIRPKDYVGIIVAYPEHIRKVFSLWIKGNGNLASGDCYSRKAFNEHGDIVYRPKSGGWKDDKNFKKYKPFNKNINHTCVDRLNELNEYCQEKGASLVVAGYPIAYGEYSDFSVDDVENFQIELGKQLNCDVISDYKAYMLPYKYFYNSVWHLNDEGAEIRTRMLISDLKIWMQNRE